MQTNTPMSRELARRLLRAAMLACRCDALDPCATCRADRERYATLTSERLTPRAG